ncbi:MAG TPA: CBS domain-containing protein [Polyangia bacterium]
MDTNFLKKTAKAQTPQPLGTVQPGQRMSDGLEKGSPTLADVVCTRLVRLPPWFTLAQAVRVAELRGVDHVLVEEQGRVRGFVDRRTLREGKPLDTLARWMNRSETFVEPHVEVAEARRLMRGQGLSCLLVARGGILMGTVSADDLDCAAAHSDGLRAA